MRSFLTYTFFVLCTHSIAQRNNHTNALIGFGPLYFFNDKTLDRYIGNSEFFGINYQLNNKSQTMSFNPAFQLQANQYKGRMLYKRMACVNQYLCSIRLDVLMKVSRRIYVRVGLLFNGVFDSSLFITEKYYNGNGHYGQGEETIKRGYFVSPFQAGLTLGISLPFRLFKQEQKFNITVNQIASRIVSSDYTLSGIYGGDVRVLSVKARPTMLTLGFDFNLRSIKKKKKDETKTVQP